MRPGRRASRRGLALLALLAVVAAGCGDPALWARYRAEHDDWHARKLADRIRVNPGLASVRDYERATAAFESVARRFPPVVWGRNALPGPARDVAMAAGGAEISIGRLEEMRGDREAALARFSRVESEWRAVPPVALAGAVARADAHQRWGLGLEAAAEWREIALSYPLVDDESGEAIGWVLEAPLRAARLLRHAGRADEADSLLRAVERRAVGELHRYPGAPGVPELWARMAEWRGARGDVAGALAAGRTALRDTVGEPDRGRYVLALGRLALEGGWPDTARAYAAWADTGFGRAIRAAAHMLIADAWETRGLPDSALVAYQRYLDEFPQLPAGSAQARFRRGMIYERVGSWEQAHSEYRALEAAQPTDTLAFASLLRIVNHHLSRGEDDLAQSEAQQAIEQLDQILTGQRDETVALEARLARGQLLERVGRDAEAFDVLTDVWRRASRTSRGAQAAIEAASLAERRLHDVARARALYQDVAARTDDEDARQTARAALERLRPATN